MVKVAMLAVQRKSEGVRSGLVCLLGFGIA
jgi:hypothetical protein